MMFGKIVKHELLANIKLYGIMLGIGLLVAVGAFIGATPINDSHFFVNYTGVSAMMMVAFTTIALMLVILLHFIWQGIRYAKSMYGKEGYLSFTLPVSPITLILGKFTAFFILGIGVVLLCGILVFSNFYSMMSASYMQFNHGSASEIWGMFWLQIKQYLSQPHFFRFVINLAVTIVLRMLLFSNYIILAVTLANLPCFSKGNTVLTFVFLYFIPYIEEKVIGFFLTAVVFAGGRHFFGFWQDMAMAVEIGDFPTIWNGTSSMMWGSNIIYLILVGAHMVLVIWLVKKYLAVTA